MALNYLFNNGFQQPTGQSALAFNANFVRSWGTNGAIRDPSGAASANDTPRYAGYLQLLCGAPSVETPLLVSGEPYHALYASGFAANGTDVLTVIKLGSASSLRIYQNSLSGSPVASSTIYASSGPKVGMEDLLLGVSGEEESDYVHGPTSFAVAWGLVIAVCEVRQQINPNATGEANWRPVGTSVCYWQSGQGWKLKGAIRPHQADKRRGASFQLQGVRVLSFGSGGLVDKLYVVFGNYVNAGEWPTGVGHQPDGGQVIMFTATRPNASTAWTLQTVASILTLPGVSGSMGYHVHTAYVERWGSSGLRVVVPIGDVWPNNRVIALYRDDESYTDGEASPTDTGGGSPTNGWTTRDNRHGSSGYGSAPVGEGNQFVGAAPLGPVGQDDRGHLIGGDESIEAIMKVVKAAGSDTDKINFFRLWGTGSSVPRPYGYNCFHVTNANPAGAGPYFAFLTTGQGWPTELLDLGKRMLYSPDGEHWGVCWALGPSHEAPGLIGNKLAIGTPSSAGLGVRQITVPTVTIQRPLHVAGGGKNYLEATACASVLSGSVDDQHSVTAITNSASALAAYGAPPPPCLCPNVFRCRRSESSGSDTSSWQMGIWQLSGSGTGELVPAGKIKVRLWLYPIPWGASLPNSETTTNSSATFPQVSVGAVDTINPLNSIAFSREAFDVGPIESVGDQTRGWIPVTVATDSATWRSDGNASQPQTSPFVLGIRLRNRPTILNAANPCDFLVAFDYVVSGGSGDLDHPAIPLPLDLTAHDAERAAITGFACGSSFTIEHTAMIPDDGWDQVDRYWPSPAPPILTFGSGTLSTTSGSIAVRARSDQKVEFKWDTGETLLLEADDPETFGFLRGNPVFISISGSPSSTPGLTKYLCAVSVGGSSPVHGTLDAPTVSIGSIRFGIADFQQVCPMLHFGGRIDTENSKDAENLQAGMRNLGMLYLHTVPFPPGGLEN